MHNNPGDACTARQARILDCHRKPRATLPCVRKRSEMEGTLMRLRRDEPDPMITRAAVSRLAKTPRILVARPLIYQSMPP